jgi:sugar phosphate isomerase/epimerase
LIADSAELYTMLKDRDPRYVGAIWDAAHDALTGREPEVGLELVWSHLVMVNLKNAYYRRVSGPEADPSEWQRYFTTGPHGLASWPRIIAYLQKRQYQGPLCLTAEYTQESDTNVWIERDVTYVRQLLETSKFRVIEPMIQRS